MYRQKMCLGIDCFQMAYEDSIRLIKQVGFEAFFINWKPETDYKALKEFADSEGMIVQSIHAPFHKMRSMWYEDERTEEALKELYTCVDDAVTLGTDIMIVHAFIGFDEHEPNQTGIENYRKVVEYAAQKGVRVALENTEGEEYLAALMDAFKGYKNVGFCWDTGHEMCYNRMQDMTKLYGDRLIATHINDNVGIIDYEGKTRAWDDLHLLPFDGIIDWNSIADRLNAHGFNDILTFEMNKVSKPGRHENDAYTRMSDEEYATQIYIRACRIGQLKLNRK